MLLLLKKDINNKFAVIYPMKLFAGLIIFLIGNFSVVYAENADELYRQGKFAEAEKEYRKADMNNPKDVRFRYNRGCAAFKNSDYKTAEAAFTSVLRRSEDKEIQYKAAYNLGNTAFIQNDFASAAELYKRAIILNPDSREARHNFELSLRRLEEQKQDKDKTSRDQNNSKSDKTNDSRKGSDNRNGDGKEERADKINGSQQDQREKRGEKSREDIKGELNAVNPGDKPRQEESASVKLNREKAEALLDNVKEDRARILQLQNKGIKQSPASGKTW
jgi:Ca-activated chloride channel homolog